MTLITETYSIADIFDEQGVLSGVLENYAPRAVQIDMATAVANTIEEDAILLAEAGTGVGKTFAYLVPAILADKKIIISTGTKNLQDQLFFKDLPTLNQILPVKSSLLKGRANYLCLYRLKLANEEGQFVDKQSTKDLRTINTWATATKTGDIVEVEDVAEDANIWPYVTSTTDNCLGQDCPLYQECHLIQARRKAAKSQIVVVNHHLFFADLAMRDDNSGELLPKAEVVVFDEAHLIPGIASQFFSVSISSRQLLDLCRDIEVEYMTQAKDLKSLGAMATRLQVVAADFRLQFNVSPERAAWQAKTREPKVKDSIEVMTEALTQLVELLENARERSEGLQNCYERAVSFVSDFKQVIHAEDKRYIHWYETYSKSFRLFMTPIDIAEPFQNVLSTHPGSFIFTSATLTIDGSFDYFKSQLGLENVSLCQLESPFDYKSHARLYFPRYLPSPNKQDYTERFIASVLPIMKQLRGKTFLLFTSHSALKKAKGLLEHETAFECLVQGDKPKPQLLAEFRSGADVVLLGTASFWEGVDVRGSALSCVAIDKLPFLSPGDPIHQARIEAIQAKGQDAFQVYQLPQAVIALKQGVGRLIRDISDQGVIVIGDPRLLVRDYGEVFLASLPDMPYTREPESIEQFIDENIRV